MNLTKYIPLACLSGILFIVAWNMSEAKNFISLFKNSKQVLTQKYCLMDSRAVSFCVCDQDTTRDKQPKFNLNPGVYIEV
jgi:hypothetical protein